jgi:hypothetical protein
MIIAKADQIASCGVEWPEAGSSFVEMIARPIAK